MRGQLCGCVIMNPRRITEEDLKKFRKPFVGMTAEEVRAIEKAAKDPFGEDWLWTPAVIRRRIASDGDASSEDTVSDPIDTF